ncbi:MAG: AI-2E family transporter [Lachnospirales bacterium]
MKNIQYKSLIKIAVVAVIGCLTVIYFNTIIDLIGLFLNVSFPLILGAIMAFILDIPLRRLESIYFPKSQNKWIKRTRRPVCIALAFVVLALIILLIIWIVIPEMISCFQFIAEAFPPLFEEATQWLSGNFENVPMIQNMLDTINVDWEALFSNIMSSFVSGAGGVFSSVFNTLINIVSGVVQTFIAFIFAIYIVANKEKLKRQTTHLMEAYMRPIWKDKILSVLQLSNSTFSNYFAGQCIEALIFGTLCFIGMQIFRFPYSLTISILIGVTALIPLVGAFIGAFIGAVMILTVSPLQMLFFLIFIIVLQQIEGNMIFPRVVGTAVSLPGLWTLAAVTLGGGLFGILGIFICVPAASVLYQLLRTNVHKHLVSSKKEAPSSKPASDDAKLPEEDA